MSYKINNYLNIIKREISRISKDKNIFMMIIIVPVFYSLFYSSLYYYKTEKDVPVCVVDMDNSEFSRDFIQRLDANELTKVDLVLTDLDQAKKLLQKMNIHGIIYIPMRSENDLKLNKAITIKAYLNTTRFLVSNDINKAVNQTAFSFGDDAKKILFQKSGLSSKISEKMIEPLRLEDKPLFNTLETYGDFLIPGLIVLIIYQTLMIGMSESMSKEREENTISELKRISGGKVLLTLAGKGTFYLILYSAYSFFLFTVIFRIFSIKFEGDYLALSVMTIMLILSAIFFCILISSFFKRKIISLQVLAFSSYPVFLVSGYIFPFQSLPFIIRLIAITLPTTPYLNAFIRLTQMNAGMTDIKPQLLHLFLIMITSGLLAIFRMKIIYKKTDS